MNLASVSYEHACLNHLATLQKVLCHLKPTAFILIHALYYNITLPFFSHPKNLAATMLLTLFLAPLLPMSLFLRASLQPHRSLPLLRFLGALSMISMAGEMSFRRFLNDILSAITGWMIVHLWIEMEKWLHQQDIVEEKKIAGLDMTGIEGNYELKDSQTTTTQKSMTEGEDEDDWVSEENEDALRHGISSSRPFQNPKNQPSKIPIPTPFDLSEPPIPKTKGSTFPRLFPRNLPKISPPQFNPFSVKVSPPQPHLSASSSQTPGNLDTSSRPNANDSIHNFVLPSLRTQQNKDENETEPVKGRPENAQIKNWLLHNSTDIFTPYSPFPSNKRPKAQQNIDNNKTNEPTAQSTIPQTTPPPLFSRPKDWPFHKSTSNMKASLWRGPVPFSGPTTPKKPVRDEDPSESPFLHIFR